MFWTAIEVMLVFGAVGCVLLAYCIVRSGARELPRELYDYSQETAHSDNVPVGW